MAILQTARRTLSVADVLSSLITTPITHGAGMTNLDFPVLTEFFWGARLTVTLSFPVRALMHRTFLFTGDTPLAAVTMPVELILVVDAAAPTPGADKELPTLRVVRCHSQINGDEHGPVIPLTAVSSKMSLPSSPL